MTPSLDLPARARHTGRDTARRAISAVAGALRKRSLRGPLLAFALFATAELATWLAILVFAYDRGGATEAGLIAAAQLLPAAAGAPLSGILAERVGYDRALSVGYGAQAVAFAGVGVAMWTGAPAVLTYPAAVVAAWTITLSRPTHFAVLPRQITSAEELGAANAASTALEGLGCLFGPAVGGLAIAVSGPELAFGAGAVLVAIAAAACARVRTSDTVDAPSPPEGLVGGLRATLAVMRRRRGVRSLLALVGVQFVMVGMLEVLMVVWAVDVLGMGESGAGALGSSVGAGGLAGAIAVAAIVGRRRLLPWVLAASAGAGIPLVFVVAGGPALAIAMLALTGVAHAMFDVSTRTILQRTIRPSLLCRVFGIQESLTMAGLALGAIAAPAAVAAFGPAGAGVAAGALIPGATLLALAPLLSLDTSLPGIGDTLRLVRPVRIFSALPPAVFEAVGSALERTSVAANTTVFRQGDRGDLFYVIEHGTAVVLVDEEPCATLGAGDYFGELALMRDAPRSATIRARTDLDLLTLARVEFLAAVAGIAPEHGVAGSMQAAEPPLPAPTQGVAAE